MLANSEIIVVLNLKFLFLLVNIFMVYSQVEEIPVPHHSQSSHYHITGDKTFRQRRYLKLQSLLPHTFGVAKVKYFVSASVKSNSLKKYRIELKGLSLESTRG